MKLIPSAKAANTAIIPKMPYIVYNDEDGFEAPRYDDDED